MNKLITPDEMAKDVYASMKKHGILKMIKDATPKDRAILLKALANMFGARFP